MDSFEGTGLSTGMVESLSAEGFEFPTSLQAVAIPVIRRGHNFVAEAGPGAGTLISFGAPLLDRLAEEGEGRVIVISTDDSAADERARALARLAIDIPLRVAAAHAGWQRPFDADVLFATPERLMSAVRASALKLEDVTAVVVDGAALTEGDPDTEALVELAPADAQRIVYAQPFGPEADSFATRHAKRAPRYPVRSAKAGTPAPRESIAYRIVPEPRAEAVLETVGELIERGQRVAIHFPADDQAVDTGDLLALHGYEAGAPGDEVPIWLCTPSAPELQRGTGLHVVSAQVPPDAEELLRRHGEAVASTVLLSSRELPHLRGIAADAGFQLVPSARVARSPAAWHRLEERIVEAAGSGRLAPYLLAAERLAERFDPLEIAAAALSMIEAPAPPSPEKPVAPGRRVEPWVRVFLSIGAKDGVRPGDLVGAITGEANVPAEAVGKIEIRDTFSLVEMTGDTADRVIKALNGTSIRGRAIRADYDRQSTRRRRTR